MEKPTHEADFRPLSKSEAEELDRMLNADQSTGPAALAVTPSGQMQVVNRNELSDQSGLTSTTVNMGRNFSTAN